MITRAGRINYIGATSGIKRTVDCPSDRYSNWAHCSDSSVGEFQIATAAEECTVRQIGKVH
jgi:hypothetical protein